MHTQITFNFLFRPTLAICCKKITLMFFPLPHKTVIEYLWMYLTTSEHTDGERKREREKRERAREGVGWGKACELAKEEGFLVHHAESAADTGTIWLNIRLFIFRSTFVWCPRPAIRCNARQCPGPFWAIDTIKPHFDAYLKLVQYDQTPLREECHSCTRDALQVDCILLEWSDSECLQSSWCVFNTETISSLNLEDLRWFRAEVVTSRSICVFWPTVALSD